MNFETLPPVDPYWVRTRLVFNTDTVAGMRELVDKAVAVKARLILTFHIITEAPSIPGADQFDRENFRQIPDQNASKGVAVLPYGEVLAKV
ncbi:hypothetical protein [Citricoccus sp. K5]|uniref:hypothetical protein n=1 Tax=Citricoccus sp. K5 TaxID=2653135 RepID=UPI0012F14F5D|nr:hypothetical protein [Citricoccus sp. K5]VXA97262.1 hypothetical protein CITRIK5_110021 [Citricoccus sp. K5]